jgi:quercetin dioxygenase-like cupin family protein
MRVALLVLLAFLMAFAVGPAGAATSAGAETATFVHAKDLVFGPAPPSLPAGARIAVLLGDPAADGPFVIRLMLPKGYRIPPHSHKRDEQVTVISGTMYLGMGDVFEPSTARGLAAGGFHMLRAGTRHFAYAKQPTIVQVSGNGPFDITYVKPADDPRTAAR